MPTTVRCVQGQIKRLLARELGGNWQVKSWDNGMVTFVNRHAPTRSKEVANVEDVKTECIQLCHLRLALHTCIFAVIESKHGPCSTVESSAKDMEMVIQHYRYDCRHLFRPNRRFRQFSSNMYISCCGKCRFRLL